MKGRIVEEIDEAPAIQMPAITEEMLERSRRPGKSIQRSPDDRAKSQAPVFF